MTDPTCHVRYLSRLKLRLNMRVTLKGRSSKLKKCAELKCKKIPADIDYYSLKGLRLEAVEKLSKIKPENLGQASRISGVNPADIAALNIILETL